MAYVLNDVNYHAIREATEEALATISNSLAPYMNEKALEMHLQRIVGAHIGSAHGAGSFYDSKAEQARNLTSAMLNDHRDEDRMGVDGQANRAERARDFAAIAAVQAYAALAAAHGAKDAYAEITGQESGQGLCTSPRSRIPIRECRLPQGSGRPSVRRLHEPARKPL